MSFHTLRLVLGDQLNAAHSWYADDDPGILYVIAELRQETDYVRHHVQKVCAFFAAMSAFAESLEASGKPVRHLTLDDTAEFGTLPDLLHHLLKDHGIRRFEYQRPDEHRLLAQFRSFKFPGGECVEFDSEHFLLPFDEIPRQFEAGKQHRMEFFYRRMRKRFDVLVEDGEPRGGKWNYDQDNRESMSADDAREVPEPLLFSNPVGGVLERLERHGVDTFGNAADPLPWPINREQALELLKHFCSTCLEKFGRFQDAMTTATDHAWTLYHSRLSFALNVKLLHPMEVIQAALNRFETRSAEIGIAQVEGFVRQVLGWREFIRGVYWANMPAYADANHLEARRELPAWFWTGETRMQCLRQAIGQSLQHAYAHHIQRLMVTGNFCLLAGIDPDAVDAWYLGVYIDAIEWVEMPNTRGMTQYADGGLVASKPYAASGAYINRMSDYCGQCEYRVKARDTQEACPLNSLYWHFLARHGKRLRDNGRLRMAYRNLDRMDDNVRDNIIARGDWCLENLDRL